MIRTETADVPGTPENEAVSTDPAAGNAAKKGDGVVLTVASGLVNLPDLVGMTEEEAIDVLDELELRYSVFTEETDEVDEGLVARQSRSDLVPYNVRVEIYIAIKPEPTTAVIPDDIIGKSYEDARDQLEGLQLRVRQREEVSDQPVGTVLYSEPGVGTEVNFNSIVTLVTAKAPDPPPDTETPDPPDDGGDGAGDSGGRLSGQAAGPTTPDTRRKP